MADDPENLFLRYLRRIDEKVDTVREDIREVKTRLGRLETDVAQLHVALAEHSNRFDRIERRLDLVEP